jgi:ABC-type lipoprotein release transport system permease subunit
MRWMALRNLWRQRRRTLITASAVGLGLALFLFLLGYIEGVFVQAVDASAGVFIGDAQIHHPSYRAERDAELLIPDPEQALARARGTAGVTAAAPRHYVLALAGMGDRSANVQVIGIDFAEEPKVTRFHQRLLSGSWPTTENQAVIGRELAEKLELAAGDKLVLTAADAKTGDLRSVAVRVSGIVGAGNALLDRDAVITSLSQAQGLDGLTGQLHEIALKLSGPNATPEAMEPVLAALRAPEIEVAPWQTVNKLLWTAYQFQKNLIYMLAIVVFAVASFSIVNTLSMSFAERIREFGVLRALGTTPRRLVLLLLAESSTLGVMGALGGAAFGLLLCLPFAVWGLPIDGLEFSGVQLREAIYFRPQPEHVLTLAPLFAFLTAATGVFAAWRAARLRPIQALHHT